MSLQLLVDAQSISSDFCWHCSIRTGQQRRICRGRFKIRMAPVVRAAVELACEANDFGTQLVIDDIPLTNNRSPGLGPEIEASDQMAAQPPPD